MLPDEFPREFLKICPYIVSHSTLNLARNDFRPVFRPERASDLAVSKKFVRNASGFLFFLPNFQKIPPDCYLGLHIGLIRRDRLNSRLEVK